MPVAPKTTSSGSLGGIFFMATFFKIGMACRNMCMICCRRSNNSRDESVGRL